MVESKHVDVYCLMAQDAWNTRCVTYIYIYTYGYRLWDTNWYITLVLTKSASRNLIPKGGTDGLRMLNVSVYFSCKARGLMILSHVFGPPFFWPIHLLYPTVWLLVQYYCSQEKGITLFVTQRESERVQPHKQDGLIPNNLHVTLMLFISICYIDRLPKKRSCFHTGFERHAARGFPDWPG